MEKKRYIKPSAIAFDITSTEIICGSELRSGGPGNPSAGRAKDGYGDYGDFDISFLME